MSPLRFNTVNPSTGEPIESFTTFTPAETEHALSVSERAFHSFRTLPIQRRADLLTSLAAVLRRHQDSLAKTITSEMGKVVAEAEAEVEKCARTAAWYAEHGPAMLADEAAPTGRTQAYVSYLPMGPILAVMPWNFPLWQVVRFCVPTLLAGNTVLVKHSPNTQRSSLELERVFVEAGFPEGVVQNLILSVEDVGGVIEDRRVQGVSVTGSVRAGAAVASRAGAVIKKSVLELGGSDAFIVLKDADVPRAVAAAVRGRFSNAGQVCLAAKRFLLAEEIAPAFEEQFVHAAEALKVGDPLDRSHQIGPIARADLRAELERQVQNSVAQGATVLSGGGPIAGRGFFYRPTVLTGVTLGMPVFDDETFGPVAALTRVQDADAAVAAANASRYGLSANIWTGDPALARSMARELETGGVFINGITATDPRIPVGGVKQSGYGRELSHFGAHAFVNVQTVWIEDLASSAP